MAEKSKPAQEAAENLAAEDLDKVVGGGSTGTFGSPAEKGAKFGSKQEATKYTDDSCQD